MKKIDNGVGMNGIIAFKHNRFCRTKKHMQMILSSDKKHEPRIGPQ